MEGITFLHPGVFWVLLVIPFYVAWYIYKRKTLNATIQLSTIKPFAGQKRSWKSYLRHVPMVLRMLALVAVVAVIARPQSSNSFRDEKTEGIDIVMAIDISGSMQAIDFKPNRLEAAKDVGIQFISSRPNDNIGLVIFAGESFTQCPLTTDHTALTNLFNDVTNGMLEDGTAIGMGLATSISRIKDSKAKSKVIILLTDGCNNRGDITPQKAAEIAQTFGIRVYTIGVGTRGTAQVPVQVVTPYGINGQQVQTQYVDQEVNIDEELMTKIADMTGGKYFRATNKKSLQAIYEEIDEMEKTILDVREYTKKTEEYLPFAIVALLLLLLEVVLRNTILRTLP
ncbi:MAG: VWA domain-containing protein [Bacteroidales bacterium]|nr:VWA domain-containing protein [Bacteroidales bacterium]